MAAVPPPAAAAAAAAVRGAPRLRLVRPAEVHLPSYVAALERGYSPDNVRGAIAAQEQLQQIAADAQAFLALMDDPDAKGPPVTMPDGSTRARIPGLRRWMWLGAGDESSGGSSDESVDGDGGEFVGSIGLRWTADGSPLPPHVLGHIGYAVVPWHQRQGHATRALALMLDIARERGLAEVEITTDPDNLPSQRVIEANGGVLRERFDKGEAYAHAAGLRYVIALRGSGTTSDAPG
jgi:predicted acetyltransferase